MFNFSDHMERLVRDVVRHSPDLAHVDCDRILITVSQQRKFGRPGLYARVVPLRFEHGGFSTKQYGAHWGVPPFTRRGREILYLVTFCLPRFQNISFEAKGVTIFHELYHISPFFNGDLRRFPGKYYQHGPCEKAYDAHMLRLFQAYLARRQRAGFLDFLRSRFHHLEDRFGQVFGLHVPTPAPVRLGAPEELLAPAELRVRQATIASARTLARQSA